jgi:predicted nucleic acid-binding protein
VSTGWLLDTSAIAVSDRPQVARRLSAMLRSGVLYTCPVLDIEALAVARSPQAYRKMATDRSEAYRTVPIGANVAERAVSLQARLSSRAHYDAVSARDLLVAASAIENGLTVLHYRRVFELLGELCELEQRTIAPLGSLR